MAGANRGPGLGGLFVKGFNAGFFTLILWFIARLGGLAPFPPESALVYLFSVIPESIQEPAVQNLGEGAGLLGLLVAVIIAAAVYGLLAICFDRLYLPKAGAWKGLSTLERTLAFSIVPWLFFGLIVLPLTGGSVFGVQSEIAPPGVVWIFPLTILVFQLLWCLMLFRSMPAQTVPLETGTSLKGAIPKDPFRRTFIERGAVLAGAAILVLAGIGSAVSTFVAEGGLLLQGGEAIRSGSQIDLQGAPAIFDDPRLAALVNSEVTSNDSFYRVAIDIFDPSVDSSVWSLSLNGLVANPKTYSLADLQSLPKVQQYDTFICVSNPVNGNLISSAQWGGVRLSDLLSDAGGASPSATNVVFYSVDGYSVAIPIARALDPVSMLAYEMNGTDLPQRHGYPLRAVIPGLYGMMSAKWVRQVELIDTAYTGYWQTRGWSNMAEVQTVSFLRVPDDGSTVSLSQYDGSVMLGGYAFAGDRGISRVEVSVDGGSTWQDATLKPPASNLTWVLWAFEWEPPGPGNYVVYARATDGGGGVQTSAVAPTFPSGATGYAMSTVKVTS